MLMCHGGVMKSQALSMRQQMATYFSALVHDFEHGGVNNDFLVPQLSLCLPVCALVCCMHSACVMQMPDIKQPRYDIHVVLLTTKAESKLPV